MELTILLCFAAYTVLLFAVMWLTGRRGAKGNEAFFRAGRRSPVAERRDLHVGAGRRV